MIMAEPQVFWIVAIAIVVVLLFMIQFGWRLSDVWLDGDMLQIERPGTSFRVPLADVNRVDLVPLERGLRGFVLELDHPVGKIQKVRFLPAGAWKVLDPSSVNALAVELQTSIDAARGAVSDATARLPH
jgi:hypothetical protein